MPCRLLPGNAVLQLISWLSEIGDQNPIWDASARVQGLIRSPQRCYRVQLLCSIYFTLISATTLACYSQCSHICSQDHSALTTARKPVRPA